MKCWLMSKTNKKHFSAKYIVVVVLLGLLSFFTSCQKDSGVGSNILPANDILGAYVSDTTTILSSIKLKDSILSNSTSLYLLGSYNDPVFGTTKASVYTQVLPPGFSASYSFGPGCVLDSVVLVLPYNVYGTNVYGSLSPQTFVVDTIVAGGEMVSGKAYYSDTNVLHSSTHVGMVTVTPNPLVVDSFFYDTAEGKVGFTSQLRIKLNNSYGQLLLNQNTGLFSYNTLKGLYITPMDGVQLPGQGGILYLDPYLPGTGLDFYYKVGGKRQFVQVFQLGSSAASFVHFDHDYSTTAFYAGNKDSVLSPNVTYIQGMAGVKTQLSFPFLSNWKKLGPVIVNMAQVIVPVNVSATGSDQPPPQAYLIGDSAGHEFIIPDQNLGSYGGVYDGNNHQYIFNIARYIQQVLDGKIVDRGLYLQAGSSAISANGAVLYGASKSNPALPRIRLKLYYTPLKH